MNIPSKKLESGKEVGYDSQVQLIKHLGLKEEDGIPWSFTINEIVTELRPIKEELTKSIDWGHSPHHERRSKDRPPKHIQKRLEEGLEALQPIDLLESAGLTSFKTSPQEQTGRLTDREKNDAKKRQLQELDSEFQFYFEALLLARAREKNKDLRRWLIRWISATIETSTRAAMKGKTFKIDKYKNVKRLVFDGITASTSDDETTIKVNTRELTRRPIRYVKRRYWTERKGGELDEDKHSNAVLYIDWRESRISDEQSWRGKTDSFWRFMLNWIKDEILEEVVEALILGVFKGVATAIKGIYRTAKYLRKARRYKKLRTKGDELGDSAKALKNALGKRSPSSKTKLDSRAAEDQQTISKTGHDRATGKPNSSTADDQRGVTNDRPSDQNRGRRERNDPDDAALDITFRGGRNEGFFETSPNLKRGNFGERTATEALAADGHKIIDFKPSILGTNQGGIDMVTMCNGVVYFIDNKALTRTGNVSSVSALTTNFAQNLRTVRRDLSRRLASHGTIPEQRRVLQETLDAIDNGSYVRAVTNANFAPDTKILSGVTKKLSDQEIKFIDVMRNEGTCELLDEI